MSNKFIDDIDTVVKKIEHELIICKRRFQSDFDILSRWRFAPAIREPLA